LHASNLYFHLSILSKHHLRLLKPPCFIHWQPLQLQLWQQLCGGSLLLPFSFCDIVIFQFLFAFKAELLVQVTTVLSSLVS